MSLPIKTDGQLDARAEAERLVRAQKGARRALAVLEVQLTECRWDLLPVWDELKRIAEGR